MKEINKEILSVFLRKTFPGATARYVGEGWTSVAFEMDDKIIRFPRENPDKYIKESVVCTILPDFISFAVPDIQVIQGAEYPYAIHKKLMGRTWNLDYVNKLSPDAQVALAQDCAEFLSQIHGIDVTALNTKTKSKGVDLKHNEHPDKNFGDLEFYLKAYFSKQDLAALAKKYDAAKNFNIIDTVFCHNDFHGNNCVLGENNRLVGVFDWGNCRIDERTRDFMRLFFLSPDKTFFRRVSRAYENKTGVHIDEARLVQLNMIEILHISYWLNKDDALKSIKESDLESWVIPAIAKFVE